VSFETNALALIWGAMSAITLVLGLLTIFQNINAVITALGVALIICTVYCDNQMNYLLLKDAINSIKNPQVK